jgi:maltooligosyltrehalose trehalohydrolase
MVTSNRAFGERISHLAPPERLSLARAGVLLSPQVPLLYMGEEWDASNPFLFFVDFSQDEALASAVREGRRREFANFKSFTEQEGGIQIPDPTLEESVRLSVLDWDEASRPRHAEARAETRRLLRLRREEIVPLTMTAFLGATRDWSAPGCLSVTWRFAGGTLSFVANLSDQAVELDRGEPEQIIWASPSSNVAGGRLHLPSWTGVFIKSAAA